MGRLVLENDYRCCNRADKYRIAYKRESNQIECESLSVVKVNVIYINLSYQTIN